MSDGKMMADLALNGNAPEMRATAREGGGFGILCAGGSPHIWFGSVDEVSVFEWLGRRGGVILPSLRWNDLAVDDDVAGIDICTTDGVHIRINNVSAWELHRWLGVKIGSAADTVQRSARSGNKPDLELLSRMSSDYASVSRELNKCVEWMFYDTLRTKSTMPTLATEETLMDDPVVAGGPVLACVAGSTDKFIYVGSKFLDAKVFRVGTERYTVTRVVAPEFTFDTIDMRDNPNRLNEELLKCVAAYTDDIYRRHTSNEIHVATVPRLWIDRKAYTLSGVVWGYVGSLVPRERTESGTHEPSPVCACGCTCEQHMTGDDAGDKPACAGSDSAPAKDEAYPRAQQSEEDRAVDRLKILEDAHGGKLMRVENLPPRYDEVKSWMGGRYGSRNVLAVLNDELRLKWYTRDSLISVCIRLPGPGCDNGYIGAIRDVRAPRPGETWTRGNDMADGPYCKETWDRVIADAAFCDTVCPALFEDNDLLTRGLPREQHRISDGDLFLGGNFYAHDDGVLGMSIKDAEKTIVWFNAAGESEFLGWLQSKLAQSPGAPGQISPVTIGDITVNDIGSIGFELVGNGRVTAFSTNNASRLYNWIVDKRSGLPRTEGMACTQCGVVKSVDEFETPDMCAQCVKEHSKSECSDPDEANLNGARRVFRDADTLTALCSYAHGMSVHNLNPEDAADYMAIASAAARMASRQRVSRVQKSRKEAFKPWGLDEDNDLLTRGLKSRKEAFKPWGLDAAGDKVETADDATYKMLRQALGRHVVSVYLNERAARAIEATSCDMDLAGAKVDDRTMAYQSTVTIGGKVYDVQLVSSARFAKSLAECRHDMSIAYAAMDEAVKAYLDEVQVLFARSPGGMFTPATFRAVRSGERVDLHVYGFAFVPMIPKGVDPAAPGADHSAVWIASAPQPELKE